MVIDREDAGRAVLPDALLNSRIRAQGGSFFEAVPAASCRQCDPWIPLLASVFEHMHLIISPLGVDDAGEVRLSA